MVAERVSLFQVQSFGSAVLRRSAIIGYKILEHFLAAGETDESIDLKDSASHGDGWKILEYFACWWSQQSAPSYLGILW